MARAPFAATWWGAQWLNALHAVDSDNRLPRGRRYANNGSVKELHVDGGQAEARVQGSRRSPYRVTLEVPPLPAEQTSELLDAIATSPGLIGRLFKRRQNTMFEPLTERRTLSHIPPVRKRNTDLEFVNGHHRQVEIARRDLLGPPRHTGIGLPEPNLP